MKKSKNRTDNAITVSSLSFRFEKEPVLSDLSFTAQSGSFLSILGPNGSGKTTLLRSLYGWLRPEKRTVFIDGKDVTACSRRELSLTVAHVAQQTQAETEFSVEETLMMGRSPHLRFLEREGPADREKVEEALRLTDTAHLRGRLITTLSGGELKRVMIASALAQDTEILLLDEPTAHLDIQHEHEILSLLKRMQREKGLTVVAVFHDLNGAAEFSDRIILLTAGRLLAHGTPADVITAERIREAYGIEMLVIPHPESGRPCVLRRAGS